MASLYKKDRSPFWWIRYRHPQTGKWTDESTKCRIGVGPDTRRAEQKRAEYTLRETQTNAANNSEQWDVWVPGFIDTTYAGKPASHLRYSTAWRTIKMFLAEKEITVPRQFKREHCFEYINVWRKKANKSEGKYRAGHNTALLELKFIGLVMGEAFLRGYAPGNPCYKLKIRRLQGKIKPELPEQAVKMIRDAIQSDPVLKADPKLKQFFNNSFEIAIHHGVRLSETHFNPQERVRFIEEEKAMITFHGKGDKINSVYLHPKLNDLMRELLDSGATETYTPPSSPAKYWFLFLTRHGIKKKFPNACFHSTRVTVATKLARAGVSEKQAMKYISHASVTVHRSYVRLQAEDLSEVYAAI